VFIRRLLDFVEISWGNQGLPGAPAEFYFTTPLDTLYLDVRQLAEPLYQALEAATQAMDQSGISEETEIAALRRAVRRIPETVPDEREGWYLCGEPNRQVGTWSIQATLATALGKFPEAAQALTASVPQLSPAVAMFGSAALAIGPADAGLLAQALRKAFIRDVGPTAHDTLVQDQPLAEVHAAYEEGYDLTLNLLDTLKLPGEQTQRIDVAQLLRDLGISISPVELEDDGLRGVALAGPDLQPTILINTHHPMNQHESGYRITLAHELCHVLHGPGLCSSGIPGQRSLGTTRRRTPGQRLRRHAADAIGTGEPTHRGSVVT